MHKIKKDILKIQNQILSGEISKDNRDGAKEQIKALKEKYERINERFQVMRHKEKDVSSEKVDNRIT